MGLLIDLSRDLDEEKGLTRALEISKKIERKELENTQYTILYYYISNIWGNLAIVRGKIHERAWDWSSEETEKQIFHLRRALCSEGFSEIPKIRKCQILTNLGNLMDYVGRFVEAIEYYDRALELYPPFSMALGNKGLALYYYAGNHYDERTAMMMLDCARKFLKKAISTDLHPEAKKKFNGYLDKIEEQFSTDYSINEEELDTRSGEMKEEETGYRKWCVQNNLFLNSFNDIGNWSIAAKDILTLPPFIARKEKGLAYLGFFNQMKQEYASARFLYYEGLHTAGPHFSDKHVLQYNTLDYPSYSLSTEKIKTAFRVSYSLLDKISYFLRYYFELSIKEKDTTFRTIWYDSYHMKGDVRAEFQEKKNWPLKGLFWMSKDLFEDKPGFRHSTEPDAREVNIIRNHLEHRYLKVHENLWNTNKSNDGFMFTDRLSFSITRKELEAKTLRLLKMVRAGLIYLSLTMHIEERKKFGPKENADKIPAIELDIWDDEWKT